MKTILTLPLLDPDWANRELNDIYAEYDDVQVVGVYQNTQGYTAHGVLVIVATVRLPEQESE